MMSNYKFEIQEAKVYDWQPVYLKHSAARSSSCVRLKAKGTLCWKEGNTTIEKKFEVSDSETMQKIHDNHDDGKFKVFGNFVLKDGFGDNVGKKYVLHHVTKAEIITQ